ncbi:MAG: sulfurtransferase-like selenium metabolism protein YedF [Thermoanaerobaculales bacterium]|jgi:selenium metabolism protein YedF|nr:sulfurtransferase-like selenium metabolism protein YedF [Thermoanaerobaculales bacterium]
MRELDVRNLACPGPVLTLRDLLEAGEREVVMHVADALSRSNVSRFAAARGAAVAVEEPGDGSFILSITAGGGAAGARPGEEALLDCEVPEAAPVRGPRVVQVGSAAMGAGDDELGALLLRSFLKTQSQLERRPDAILFYNSGVRLCCEGSPLLDDLQALAAAGIEIIACGTCLSYFGLAERLRVGRVSDMLEIAGRLADAGAIVRP